MLYSGLSKKLVTSADQDAHLTALGVRSSQKDPVALAVPSLATTKTPVKPAKVMLDLNRVR